MKNNYKLIIPKELIKEIDLKEISAAEILMKYFKTDISFIRRSNHKTPDFEINGLRWIITKSKKVLEINRKK